ncbi:MAG TPA: DUF3108 domain-containing protein [Rubrivivax sp.]
MPEINAQPAAVRWRLAALALVVVVTLTHLWVLHAVAEAHRLGLGAADAAPRRIEIAFVQELAPALPAPAPPAPKRRVRRAAAVVAAPATPASAPLQAETTPALPAEPLPVPEPAQAAVPEPVPAAVPEPGPDLAASAAAEVTPTTEASNAAPAAGAASGAVAFEWPPSTRLSYTLTGDYRGPVDGSAQVEWLRRESRYQVHLDVVIGPAFAPLVSRRMSSDGEITDQGLKPLRYDEETKVALRQPRRQSIAFEAERILMPGGRERPAVPGVQDTASQFVQLTWIFTTRPERLRAGEWVDIPLALPRHVDVWRYEVVGEELLVTPAGAIPTFYVRPRRERRAGELQVEAWFAPSLQYLPVRIRIRQDAETSVDLMLESLPKQERSPAR